MFLNRARAALLTAAWIGGAAHAQTVDPATQGMSAAKLAVVHQAIDVSIASGQIPGAIVLVQRNGRIVHLEARGVAGPGSTRALTTDTIFPAASLTKPVTAVAVLMLVDEGKIGLDDPVVKYIPELGGRREVRVLQPGSPPAPFSPMPGLLPTTAEFGPARYDTMPAARAITIRDLLTHTSGIQIFGVLNDFPDVKPGDTLATVIPRMGKLKLEFQPGSRWAYSSGAGFEVLGRVVEVASGQSFRAFLQQRLWGPLGMRDTDFGVHRGDGARALVPPQASHPQWADETSFFSGAAGMHTTVPDYAKFAQMLADGGQANGHRFLKPETFRAMTTNQIGFLPIGGYPPLGMPAEGLRFGYGVLVLSNPPAAGTAMPRGAFGWDGIGTRRFWAVPDEHLVIVSMVPLVGPAAAPLQRLVESAVMQSIASPPH